jgi:hypothetical protein
MHCQNYQIQINQSRRGSTNKTFLLHLLSALIALNYAPTAHHPASADHAVSASHAVQGTHLHRQDPYLSSAPPVLHPATSYPMWRPQHHLPAHQCYHYPSLQPAH